MENETLILIVVVILAVSAFVYSFSQFKEDGDNNTSGKSSGDSYKTKNDGSTSLLTRASIILFLVLLFTPIIVGIWSFTFGGSGEKPSRPRTEAAAAEERGRNYRAEVRLNDTRRWTQVTLKKGEKLRPVTVGRYRAFSIRTLDSPCLVTVNFFGDDSATFEITSDGVAPPPRSVSSRAHRISSFSISAPEAGADEVTVRYLVYTP